MNEPQGVMIVSESASELKELKDMLTDIKSSLGYMTKLLESMVEQFNLAHKHKNDATEIMKMNANLISALFAGKSFEGKEKVMEVFQKIQKMGSE